MIQDMINSGNSINITESTNAIIFKNTLTLQGSYNFFSLRRGRGRGGNRIKQMFHPPMAAAGKLLVLHFGFLKISYDSPHPKFVGLGLVSCLRNNMQ